MPTGTLITTTLVGEYLVHGSVTGYEYENLPGVTVTVTNLRTNEDDTTTVDEEGDYAIDLGDTTAGAYPAGYAIGDEIQISFTHRDTTRTWKRRVSGSEIEQDLYSTHGTWKGALRRAKLIVLDPITNKTGLTVTLRDADTRDVLSVKLNDDLITGWAFRRPNTLTLPSAITASDVLDVERSIHRSIQDAKTEIVAEGDAQVRDAMARYYSNQSANRIPELQAISEALAAARMRDMFFTSGDRPDAEAASLRKFARDRLKELYDGTRALTDQDSAFLTPTAQSTTTPRSSTTPTRKFSLPTDTRRTL